MKAWKVVSIGVSLAAGLACTGGVHSPAGFRLPGNGDAGRGLAAFVELQCTNCHRVVGEDLPEPTMKPPVPVTLGGRVYELRTDGYLVTSIINPSHRLAGYSKTQVAVEGESRMPDMTRTMSVRQLVDIVAFLQDRYEFVPTPVVH